MSTRRFALRAAVLATSVATLLLVGCDTTTPDPAEPAADSSIGGLDGVTPDVGANLRSGFYPLHTGDRWSYDRTFAFQIIPDSGEPSPPSVVLSTIESDIIGQEERFGRTYVVQENRETELDGPTFVTWIRFRQDNSGLYEADVGIFEPPILVPSAEPARARASRLAKSTNTLSMRLSAMNPAFARAPYRQLVEQHLQRHATIRAAVREMHTHAGPPGGPQPDEITRLRYPLRRGARWVIRAAPLFTSAAEGPELLELPIGRRNATRVRITPPGLGPDDEVFLWYSRCGRLRLFVHIESEATDIFGDPIGTLVSTDEEVLTDLDLRGRKGCSNP